MLRAPRGGYFTVKRGARVTQDLKDQNQSITHNDEESLQQARQRITGSQYFRRLWGGHGAGFTSPGVG